MTTLHRVLVAWSGPSVKGLAVNVLHYSASDNPAPPVAAIKSAYSNIQGYLTPGTKITIPNGGDTIEDTTGELVGTWTSGVGDWVDGGSATLTSAAGVGACISWITGGIINGRRLRGRTFIVPLATSSYEVDGTIITGAMTQLNLVAAGLMGAGPLAVWHRPTTPGGSDGNSYGVTQSRVRDHVAFLGSRRD